MTIGKQTELFFNTLNLKEETLEKAQLDCARQDIKILDFFITYHTQSFTPLEVADKLDMLFTSVRRSMTNLTSRGYLLKTEEQVQERLGKPNHKWKFRL